MTKDSIRQLDVRVRQHMLVNGQLTRQEVDEAMKDRDDLADLTEKFVVCETPAPQETPAEEEVEDEEGDDE
jgi:hypothetical protein